jgi:hypothetical protein
MARALLVQLPANGPFGTDDDFELCARLEHALSAALGAAGECDRGQIDAGRICVRVEAVADPVEALQAVKDALGRLNVLHRAAVVLETRCATDPDDIDRQPLWPIPHAARVA